MEEDFDKPTSPTCFEPHEIAQPEPDLLMSASNQGATWAPAEDGSLVPELTPPDLSNASLNLVGVAPVLRHHCVSPSPLTPQNGLLVSLRLSFSPCRLRPAESDVQRSHGGDDGF